MKPEALDLLPTHYCKLTACHSIWRHHK